MADDRGTACPSCRALAPGGQRFCGACGSRLVLPCASCGTDNPPTNRFCGQCGAGLLAAGAPRAGVAGEPPDPAGTRDAPPRDERRWATVLFADLSGYTSLSERMDHEDVKELSHSFAERLAEEIQRFGGSVLQVMGDGVLAVFGAPVAHEDDAERAIRAATAIHALTLTRPDHPDEQVRVHIGINTGEVMAGLIGPRERRDYTVVGDTVNTAHRLTTAAGPGTTLVGEETYRATHRLVRYRDVAPIDAKGKDQPLAAWEVLDVVPLPTSRPLGTTPLVGRREELTLVAGLWAKVVREARPQLVSVIGEPGIGKTRLIAELEGQVLADALVLHGRCLPYGETLGYWALGAALREAAGIRTDADAETARVALGDLVTALVDAAASGDDPDEIGSHLTRVIGLETADAGIATVHQRALHGSVRRFFELLARRQPVCLLLEDIHWADDALLDLVELVAGRANDAPLLIVTQARPELLEKRPAWGRGVRGFTSLPLEPLGERDALALVVALCREHGLPASIADQIGRGAGGNPLFAEEMVATIAERGGSTEVPSAIKALISARLDVLAPEQRRTLQLAAVFGKVFWQGGLRALGDGTAAGDLLDWLDALEQKDLLRAQPRSRFQGDREYWFKHDLIRDVAYETLPRVERRMLHGRVADWIEQRSGERLDEVVDLLAHHAVQADQYERGREYLTQAASRARIAAAHREEAGLLSQAIGVAERSGRADLVDDLRARRGRALMDLGLWAEARVDLEAALAVFMATDRQRSAEIVGELALIAFWLLETPALRARAMEALALAEEVGRDDLAAGALAWQAEATKADGDEIAARELFLKAIERVGGVKVGPLAQAPLTLYHLGRLDEAVRYGRESVTLIHELHDTATTAYGLPPIGLALAGGGKYDEALGVFAEAKQFALEHEVWPFAARAIAMSAGPHLDLYDFTRHEEIAEEARELARSVGFLPPLVSAGIDLLLNYARRGDVTRAERLLAEVGDAVEQTINWHGWLWKLRLCEARAEMALVRGETDEAIRWASDAVERSRAAGRKKYEVLGLWTRARARASAGRVREACGDLRAALPVARTMGDPALLLRLAAVLLPLDGDEALAGEAQAAVAQTVAALPTDALRQTFEAAEPIRAIGGLVAPRR